MKIIKVLFYKWHNWIGIILSVPILIVSITAFLLAFKDTLNLDKFSMSMAYMPGYSFDTNKNSIIKEAKNIKSILVVDDTMYIGTKYGLILSIGGNIWFERDLIGVDVRKVVRIEDRIYVACNKGIWIKESNLWKKLFSGDVHDVGGKEGQLFAALGKNGIIRSLDNFKTISYIWTNYLEDKMNKGEYIKELKLEKAEITLKDFVLDLHTGKAFFGKQHEWIWITMVALSIIILVITGSVLWVRKKMRRVINFVSDNKNKCLNSSISLYEKLLL